LLKFGDIKGETESVIMAALDQAIRAIRAMMEAARISETSVNIQLRTRQYIPEDSELEKYVVHVGDYVSEPRPRTAYCLFPR
jgi:hypothetical protein